MKFRSGLCILLALCVSSLHAGPWHVALEGIRLAGTTSYRMDARAAAVQGTIPIASELAFPLDTWLGGATVRWQPEGVDWFAEASLHSALSDPLRAMTDSDWRGGRMVQFSESDAQLRLVQALAATGRRIGRLVGAPVGLTGAFFYHSIAHDLVGFRGWTYSEQTQSTRPISGHGPVMKYRVSYLSPQAGAAAVIPLSASLETHLAASAGLVFARDTNDHLLRGKAAEGSATGFGGRSRAEVRFTPSMGSLPLRFSLHGEILYYAADGSQTQRWYRDETTHEGTTAAGTTYTGIPHKFRSTQYGLGISLAVNL